MYKYEILKYNPKYYADGRCYTIDEWISISDIGRSFCGKVLTDTEYMQTEDALIAAMDLILQFHSIDQIFVDNYQKSPSYSEFVNLIRPYKHLYTDELMEFYNTYKGGLTDKDDFFKLFRLSLREDVGAKMYYPRRLKFRVGYDYYVNVDSSRRLDKIIPDIEALGLFVYRVYITRLPESSPGAGSRILREWYHKDFNPDLTYCHRTPKD